jgi:CRISPR-associated endonuclease/helicase Cas3
MNSPRFDRFFNGAFNGTTGHEPFDYQRRLAGGDNGTDCRSQLINIPTGLGKTAAVMLAWLWNRVQLQNPKWPRRLAFCLPMRTLVKQTEVEVQKWLRNLLGKADELGVVGQSLEDLKWLQTHSPVILMGGEDGGEWDIYPEKPAILIGTQDMLLSRALNRGYGMSRYRWPTHFGLLNNDCLWVMDETQLMGPGLWTSGQLDWMRNHRFSILKPCVTWWMSATNSPVFLDTPDRRKEAIPLPPVIESRRGQERAFKAQPDAATELLEGRCAEAKVGKEGRSRSEFQRHPRISDSQRTRVGHALARRVQFSPCSARTLPCIGW